jgi:hypothetical protein
MERIFFAVVMLTLVLAPGAAASADEADKPNTGTCISAEDWATTVHTRSTGVAIQQFADIEGMAAKQVVDQVNAEPPETHMSADHIVVLHATAVETGEPMPYVLVAFFDRGCLVASGRADPEEVVNLLQGEST